MLLLCFICFTLLYLTSLYRTFYSAVSLAGWLALRFCRCEGFWGWDLILTLILISIVITGGKKEREGWIEVIITFCYHDTRRRLGGWIDTVSI